MSSAQESSRSNARGCTCEQTKIAFKCGGSDAFSGVTVVQSADCTLPTVHYRIGRKAVLTESS